MRQLEQDRQQKEEQNRRLAGQLRNDDKWQDLLVDVITPKETKPRGGSRKPRQSAAQPGAQSKEMKSQIREFKRANKNQIKKLLERRWESCRTRGSHPSAG